MGVASLIGSAIVGPYFYFGGIEAPSPSNVPSLQSTLDPSGYLTSYTNPNVNAVPFIPGYSSLPESVLTNAPVADFRDVLRFDISPTWVPQTFPRVTTVLAETNLDGLRVPFVSGTQTTDIAGSLTYYFDSHQTLRRIQFVGVTGDPTKLATLLLQYYHLQAEPSLGGHLYTARWNNRVTSVMQLSPAPVIYSQDTNSRFQIFLELNQPTTDYALTIEAERILQTANITNRW